MRLIDLSIDSVSVLKSALVRYLNSTGSNGRPLSRSGFIRRLHDWPDLECHFPDWSDRVSAEEFDQDVEGGAAGRPKFDRGFPVTVKVLDNWLVGEKRGGRRYFSTPSDRKLLAIGGYLKSIHQLHDDWPASSPIDEALKEFQRGLALPRFRLPEPIRQKNQYASEYLFIDHHLSETLELRAQDEGRARAELLTHRYRPLPGERIEDFVERAIAGRSNSRFRSVGAVLALSDLGANFFMQRQNVFDKEIETWVYLKNDEDKERIMVRKNIPRTASLSSEMETNYLDYICGFSYNIERHNLERTDDIQAAYLRFGTAVREEFPDFWIDVDGEVELDNIFFYSNDNLKVFDNFTKLAFGACVMGDLVALQAALLRGVSPDARHESTGDTLLIVAAKNNAIFCIRHLIEVEGASPIQTNLRGFLPSMYAEDLDVIEFLQEKEAHAAAEAGVDYLELRLAAKSGSDAFDPKP